MEAVEEQIIAPVRVTDGSVAFLPIVASATPTWLIIVKPGRENLLGTSATEPDKDRVFVGGVSLAEALGRFLMANPKLSYADIADHMEA